MRMHVICVKILFQYQIIIRVRLPVAAIIHPKYYGFALRRFILIRYLPLYLYSLGLLHEFMGNHKIAMCQCNNHAEYGFCYSNVTNPQITGDITTKKLKHNKTLSILC